MADSATIDPETGLPVEVIAPGSAEDPFAGLVNSGGAFAPPQSANPQVAAQREPSSSASEDTTAGTVGSQAAESPPREAEEPQPLEGEELEAAEAKLDMFLEEEIQRRIEQTRREMQSLADSRFAAYRKKAEEEMQALRRQIRELQAHGLSDEERAALQATWEIEDKKMWLDQRAAELDEAARDIQIAALLVEYGEYGVTEEDLRDLSPEEMMVYCADAKAAYFEELLKQVAQEERESRASAPTKPQAPQRTPAPAGARAPSDVGGGAGAVVSPTLDPTPTREAMAKNFRALPWESAPKK